MPEDEDDDKLVKGDPVTLLWYLAGEPYRPQGRVDNPTAEEVARLDGVQGDRVLVHWRGPATPDQRRWEHRADLRRDIET